MPAMKSNIISSDVNKNWTHKDQDKDKDLTNSIEYL